MEKKVMQNPKLRFVAELVVRYVRDGVSRSSAALAYHLFFTLFPALLLGSSLLPAFNVDLRELASRWGEVLPAAVRSVAADYLDYLATNFSGGMLWTGLVLTTIGLAGSLNCLLHAVRTAYRVERSSKPIYILALIFSFLLLGSTYAVLLLGALSKHILYLIEKYIVTVPWTINFLVSVFRLLVLPGFLLLIVTVCYYFVQGPKKPLRNTLPGAAAAVAGIFVATLLFTAYVTRFSRHSLLYGSIGAVMILMIWLYMVSMLLIMGAEINHVLMMHREGKTFEEITARK